jgi:hypothetical protein
VLNNHVARLDMDIIVSDAPDTINARRRELPGLPAADGPEAAAGELKLAIEMHPGLPASARSSCRT